jgi:hypothetical protein
MGNSIRRHDNGGDSRRNSRYQRSDRPPMRAGDGPLSHDGASVMLSAFPVRLLHLIKNREPPAVSHCFLLVSA